MINIEKAERSLKEVLKGLKEAEFLESIRNEMMNELEVNIDKDLVTKIFELEEGIDLLNDEQKQLLFRKVYNFSKIEELNPQVIFKTKRKKVGEMFNQEFKEEFLESKLKTEEYAVSTADTVRILFNKTAKLEKEYNKDIYEMTADELDEAMRSLKAKSVRSLQNYASKIRHYIDFAVGKGLARENLASRYRTKKDVQDLIDKDFIENMIFDKEEIMEMAEYADNAQDGVIIALTFDGLSYRDKYTELVELTKEMVDFEEGVINLPKRVEGDQVIPERKVPMSSTTAVLVRDAISNHEYVSVNGKNSRKYKLVQSEHILRGVRKGRGKINWRNINQRILRISEINDEERLNGTNVSYSGQIHYAKTLLVAGEKIETVVNKVLHRFGIPNNSAQQFYLKKRIEKYIDTEKY